jgi:hypothetical protein
MIAALVVWATVGLAALAGVVPFAARASAVIEIVTTQPM